MRIPRRFENIYKWMFKSKNTEKQIQMYWQQEMRIFMLMHERSSYFK
jgi:hypothetical protein